jgi:hypothetical protein
VLFIVLSRQSGYEDWSFRVVGEGEIKSSPYKYERGIKCILATGLVRRKQWQIAADQDLIFPATLSGLSKPILNFIRGRLEKEAAKRVSS